MLEIEIECSSDRGRGKNAPKYQIDILCWPFHAPELRASREIHQHFIACHVLPITGPKYYYGIAELFLEQLLPQDRLLSSGCGF